MAKAGGSATVYIVGLIFSILVSLALVIVAYKLNEDLTAAELRIADVTKKYDGEVQRVQTLNKEIQDIRKLVCGDERREVTYEHYKTTILDQANKKLQEILGQEYIATRDWDSLRDQPLKDAWDKLSKYKGKTDAYTNFNDLYFDIYDQLTAVIHIIPHLRYQRAASNEAVEAMRQEKNAEVARLNQEMDGLRTERNRIQDAKIEVERNFDDIKRKLLDEKEKIQNELARVQRDGRLERARLESKVAEKEARIADLTKKEKRSFGEYSKPDGEVIHADTSLGYAWIDLGRRHGLPRNLRFQVYQFVKGGRQKIKGLIEVRRLEEDMAQCAILEDQQVQHPITGELVTVPDPEDPVVKGDYIRTPLFDPHEQKTFVFLGKDAKNRFYSREELERKLEELGAKIAKQVTDETDYVVVLGDLAEDVALQDQQRLATEFGVVFLPERELLEYLGR
jgi:cell division septum initiation protein DivIVA